MTSPNPGVFRVLCSAPAIVNLPVSSASIDPGYLYHPDQTAAVVPDIVDSFGYAQEDKARTFL